MMSGIIARVAPGATRRFPRRDGVAPVPLEPATMRRLMSNWATGVSVVTSLGDDGPKGCTVNSLTSLSLDPLLLLVALHSQSSTLEAIRGSGRFCINMLASDQEDVSRRFARPAGDVDKFSAVRFDIVDGAPVLGGCLASIRCEAERMLSGGDHEIVVARPLAGDSSDAAPLIFFRRGYQAAA